MREGDHSRLKGEAPDLRKDHNGKGRGSSPQPHPLVLCWCNRSGISSLRHLPPWPPHWPHVPAHGAGLFSLLNLSQGHHPRHQRLALPSEQMRRSDTPVMARAFDVTSRNHRKCCTVCGSSKTVGVQGQNPNQCYQSATLHPTCSSRAQSDLIGHVGRGPAHVLSC